MTGRTTMAATALAAMVCATLGAAPAAAETRWGANYFPNVELTTQNGDRVHFYDLIKDKIVAIDLIYTTCDYNCPLETARMAQVQALLGDRMGRDVFFYSITIDPRHDTAKVLKKYAAQYHAGPGWLFLTGKEADIELLSKKLGLYSEPNPDNKDGHTPTLLIGNESTGQWMQGSALDNPQFTAKLIGDWMNSWKSASGGRATRRRGRWRRLTAGDTSTRPSASPATPSASAPEWDQTWPVPSAPAIVAGWRATSLRPTGCAATATRLRWPCWPSTAISGCRI